MAMTKSQCITKGPVSRAGLGNFVRPGIFQGQAGHHEAKTSKAYDNTYTLHFWCNTQKPMHPPSSMTILMGERYWRVG